MAPRHYCNNKELYRCILEHRRKSAEAGETLPVPEYAGECIYRICSRLGSRYNFRGYSWRDEMISDAIVDCINAFYIFDAERFNNPFGYMSMIAWRAMVRRIFLEKRETYVKHKSLQVSVLSGDQYDSPSDYEDPRSGRVTTTEQPGMSVSDGVVNDFESLLERRKKGGKKKEKEKETTGE